MKGNINPGIILGELSKITDKIDYLAALGFPEMFRLPRCAKWITSLRSVFLKCLDYLATLGEPVFAL
jgi:hypothetical protein